MTNAPVRRMRGFTLIEVLVAAALVAILAAVAYPSYREHLVKASRTAAQNELLELSSVQEKIYLNSNGYTANLESAYSGTAAGGLGRTGAKTADGRYTLSLAVVGQSYTLTATPVSGTPQQNDGAFSIASNGSRLCVAQAAKWCGTNGTW